MRIGWKNKKWLAEGIVITCLMVNVLTGCGNSSDRAEAAMSEVTMADNYYDKGETAEEAPQNPNSNGVPNIDTSSSYNRKVIKTGDMSIQTKTFSETVKEIVASIKQAKGYVESMDMTGVDYYSYNKGLQSATLTVRIPQESFDSFMNNGDSFGNVTNLSCNTEDITSQYVDTERHLEVLKTRYDRLLALMKEVDDYDSIFKFEKEIADVEYEINTYQGTLNEYDSVVNMSTIRIMVEEVREYTEEPVEMVTLGDQLKKGLSDSWASVVGFFRGLLIFVVCFLPYLSILVPIGLIIYVIIHKKRKSGKRVDKRVDNKEKKETEMKIDESQKDE